ncbi:hypothetical protein D9X30_0473 [Cupriavidus sp. U2]|nr:hypothetical protein D9X30_0473 [Cupriavidus sp. U2]
MFCDAAGAHNSRRYTVPQPSLRARVSTVAAPFPPIPKAANMATKRRSSNHCQ